LTSREEWIELPAELAAARDEAEREPLDDYWRHVSDQLVRLVHIVFGVVVGQSLVLYRDVIVSPFHEGRWVAALALLSIYMMIVWSWIDWNITAELRPYDFRPAAPDSTLGRRALEHFERWRLYADIAIVGTYAYTLFQVKPLDGHPGADIRYLLLGYAIVFVLYLASGELRIARYGPKASTIPPIVTFIAVSVAILVLYILLRATGINDVALNAFTLLTAWGAMYVYRWYRRYYRRRYRT
jgi:hypothetical protein